MKAVKIYLSTMSNKPNIRSYRLIFFNVLTLCLYMHSVPEANRACYKSKATRNSDFSFTSANTRKSAKL
jgi:hypothetical protein